MAYGIHLASISSQGTGGTNTAYQQDITVSAGTTNIVVTVNGGILPTSDAEIILSGPTGILQQGAGSDEYTIDRISVPNELNLGSAPLGSIDMVLYFRA